MVLQHLARLATYAGVPRNRRPQFSRRSAPLRDAFPDTPPGTTLHLAQCGGPITATGLHQRSRWPAHGNFYGDTKQGGVGDLEKDPVHTLAVVREKAH
ncbi:GAT domain-containing protein [Aspergillus luchuensis]|uniref:GAT domain-containing protein n=1 Tax=Aspergillus kawachii TaxID=1069201 RepID=A0A146FN30_ASPKA|nr:GAT domain-containing protein [Aspergillus luchuensis]